MKQLNLIKEHTNETRKGNYITRTYQETDPESPRGWDNLTTMLCFHNRYNLGDKTEYKSDMFEGWEDMKNKLVDTEDVHTILPLYLYDHSGITISTSPFGCNWDSGQVGWVFITNQTIKEEGIDESKVEEYLKSEVETYDQYLTGEVYGYKIFKVETCSQGHEHEEELDSCYGYYGEDECMKEGVRVMEYYLNDEVVV